MSTVQTNNPTCPHCSYSLEGLPMGQDCPECGNPTYYTICTTCGYLLTGLKPSDNCSECGTPCKDAFLEFSIYHAGPGYVRRLASGASLVLLSAYLVVFAIIAVFGSVIFMGQLGVLAGGNGPIVGMILGLLVYLGLLLASGIVWLVGWIRATTPDPRYLYAAPTSSSRGLTRGMAITVFCLWMCNIIPFVSSLAALANLVCGPIFVFAACTYIKKLAERTPDAKLAKTAGAVRIAFAVLIPVVVVSTLGLIVSAAGAMSTQSSTPTMAAIGMFAVFAALIGGLLLLLAYLRLVGKFAKSMKAAKQRVADLPDFRPPPAQ